MTLQEAQQSMIETEVKLRDYMGQEKRSAKELDELCLSYHMAYDVYEYRKAGNDV
jgi:hypothetical protein